MCTALVFTKISAAGFYFFKAAAATGIEEGWQREEY